MFNLFGPDKSTQEIIDDTLGTNPFNWQYVPKESIEHLRGEAEKFYKENQELKAQLKSIEEDGTEEHNAAVKLRQENAQLKMDLENSKDCATAWRIHYDQAVDRHTKLEDKVKELENEIKNWRTGVMHWKDLYDEKADCVDELMKEVNGLRHLKKENVELMERVNEIDSGQNEKYRAEIFTLKNDIAVLKNRNTELLEKYNGFVTQGGLKYMEAKLQIVQNRYKKCAEERDEYKHQLNASNKENEKLREHTKNLREQQTFLYHENEELKKEKKESFEILKKTIEDESTRFHELVAENTNNWINLKAANEEIEALKNMKTQGFEDYDPRDFEVQKQEYPIHWGGWDKVEITTSSTDTWKCPCNKCKEKRLDSSREYDNL